MAQVGNGSGPSSLGLVLASETKLCPLTCICTNFRIHIPTKQEEIEEGDVLTSSPHFLDLCKVSA
jgi:hypothetical protein